MKLADIWPFASRHVECPERLADAPAGCKVCMSGFAEDGECWRERLQAYGIAPGREIEVVQQSPVTVVRVDHVELAFESSIAREIVIAPRPSGLPSPPGVS
ncbi:MAG: ferrous iron transport protein A [Actinobacteria bacterium]|nr:ferrous iron transport protein A [Actinomycetota bacterium]